MSGFVHVASVSKRFSTVRAVEAVSFEIQPGEIFALLGPNGAGKTTLVRMLVGILRPDAGTIRFGGQMAGTLDTRHLGYLPEDRGLYRDMRVLPTLEFFGCLRGMGRVRARRQAQRWLERFELADRAFEKLDALSKGNQQKVQLISAILHGPQLAILDEPFSGLDPVNQEVFLDVIRELRDEGCTLLLSSHQMNLVEQVVDRLLVIDRGREVLNGTMEEIRGRAQAASKLRLRLEPGEDPRALAELSPTVRVHVYDSGEIGLWLTGNVSLSEVLEFASSRLRIAQVETERFTLHDIFLEAVRRGSPDVATASDPREAS